MTVSSLNSIGLLLVFQVFSIYSVFIAINKGSSKGTVGTQDAATDTYVYELLLFHSCGTTKMEFKDT